VIDPQSARTADSVAEGQPRLEKAEKGQQPAAAHRRRRHLPAPGRNRPCSRPPAATPRAGE